MSRIARFVEYAAAFEKAFETENWSLLEPYFTEDAVYEAGAPELSFGGRHEGRDAVLAHFARVIPAFDRRFEQRELKRLAGPEERGDAVWIHGVASYSAPGVPDFALELEETATFEGDRIARLEDAYTPDMVERTRAYLEAYGAKLGIET